jgi:hypothetical protein
VIRYPKTIAEIEKEIDAEPKTKTWRRRAARRTKKFIQSGGYNEKEGIWSEVKPVYLKAQYDKCAYCEQRLEGGPRGPIQYDLEHFRPKSNVRAWPEEVWRYSFPTGDALPGGYYRLAYHLGNYVAACKICNTLLKSDYFPIAGSRIADGGKPEDYAAENPYLLYPLGPGDDPADLLTFEGIYILPHCTDPTEVLYQRAALLIDFFDLNREGLLESRASTVSAVHLAHKSNATKYLEIYTRNGSHHTACARCFLAVCQTDRKRANRLAIEARTLLDSITR